MRHGLGIPVATLLLLACADAWAGVVASYAMATGADSSGNNLHLTLSGTLADPGRPSGDGAAQAFDGSTSFAQYAGGATGLLSIGSRNWTVSAWVKATSLPSDVMMIVGRYECGFDCSHGGGQDAAITNLYIADGKPGFTVRSDSDTVYVALAAAPIAAGDWHLLTGVLDRSGATLSLYVDATLAASVPYGPTETVTDTASPLSIGREFRQGWASPWRHLDGVIDDVRILDQALTAQEVASLVGVPEPGTWALVLTALGSLGAARMRNRDRIASR